MLAGPFRSTSRSCGAGLVEDRRDGLKVFYKLRVPCAMQILDCIDAVGDERPPLQLSATRRSRLASAG